MASETLKLSSGYPDYKTEIVTVEYQEIDHWLSDPVTHHRRTPVRLKRYNVLVDGEVVGTVESNEHLSSTNYAGSRIRRDLGHYIGWSWRSKAGKSNSPGLYRSTRRGAVAEMLGFNSGWTEVVK